MTGLEGREIQTKGKDFSREKTAHFGVGHFAGS